MRRRAFAILLALILVLLLCEIHICGGEDCLFCARIRDFHRIAVCVFSFMWFTRRFRAARIFKRNLSCVVSLFPYTPVDLKVRLSD